MCPWNEMDRRTDDLNPGRQAHKRTNDFARVRINRDWPLGRLFQNSDREIERGREVVVVLIYLLALSIPLVGGRLDDDGWMDEWPWKRFQFPSMAHTAFI